MFKSITLVGEEFGLQIDRNEDTGIVIIRVNDFVLDKEKSKPDYPVYKENSVIEFYPSTDEAMQIAKSIQHILAEGNSNE